MTKTFLRTPPSNRLRLHYPHDPHRNYRRLRVHRVGVIKTPRPASARARFRPWVSRQTERTPISTVHPSLTGVLDLPLENLNPTQIAERAECVFSCLPHAASAELCMQLLPLGVKVIDLSADYRLAMPRFTSSGTRINIPIRRG